MGKPQEPRPVILFIGLLTSHQPVLKEATRALIEKWGPAELESPLYPWDHSSYYQTEMGTNLHRKFMFFSKPLMPERLAEVKLQTNELEQKWMVRYGQEEKRRVNMDPGYMTPAKVILATTKDYAHRVYLHSGIYAEVTLIFRKDQFQPLEHTYPDFRSKTYLKLFGTIRERILGKL